MGWALALSVGLHLFLVALVLFGKMMGPSKREIFSPVYQVQLVGAGALPQPAPPAPPAPAPAPKPEVKPEPKPEPKPVEKPKPEPKPEVPKEAIATKQPEKPVEKPKPKPVEKPPEVDASKELEKSLQNLQSKVSDQRRYDQAINRLEKQQATRGNTVAGAFAGAPSGGAQVSTRDQLYLTELWERIQRNWAVSEVLIARSKGLVAVVTLRIRRDGSLEKSWLEQGSGNGRFDDSALRATEKASPYPPPPSVSGGVYEVGVRFRDSE